jgi:hypothetical protein
MLYFQELHKKNQRLFPALFGSGFAGLWTGD